MDPLSHTLFAKPEGLLHLFLNGDVSVELLASAFETNTQIIERSLRDAMRKREAIEFMEAAGGGGMNGCAG